MKAGNFPFILRGAVAFAFRDVIKDLCHSYEFDLGNILKKPMEGLIKFHSER